MNLGLGLIAADAFVKENQAQDIRDREKQRFDWERQRAEAEMGLLPDKAAAERSGYKLRSGQNQQGLDLLPGDTANKITEQGNRGQRLTYEKDRIPTEEATNDTKATIGLNQAANELINQPDKLTQQNNVQKIATALSSVDVDELPRTLAQKRLTNEVSQADSDLMIGAKLSDLIDAGDQNSIVRLLNAQKATSQDPKIAGMPNAASVSRATDGNGVEYLVIKDAQGKQIMAKPVESFRAAKNALAKITYEKVDAGDSMVRVQGGKVTPVYTAPESAKSLSAKLGPLERDVTYLTSRHGMTDQQALDYMRSAKQMTKQEWMNRALIERGKLGDVSKDDIKALSDMYDNAQKYSLPAAAPAAAPAPAPASSNSSGNPRINPDPKFRSLLGLP